MTCCAEQTRAHPQPQAATAGGPSSTALPAPHGCLASLCRAAGGRRESDQRQCLPGHSGREGFSGKLQTPDGSPGKHKQTQNHGAQRSHGLQIVAATSGVPAASCCLPVTTARLQTDEYKCSFRAATVVRMTPCKSMSDSSDPLPRDVNGEWPGGVPAVPAPLGQGSCARCQGRAVLGVRAEQPPLPIAGDRSCRLQLALETAQILCLQQQQAAQLKKTSQVV